jgi:hypothetical protein
MLPENKMKDPYLEHELKDSFINPILNMFFSDRQTMKYRSPENCLPERMHRTEVWKRPDAVVSSVELSCFAYTKLVGKVKNETYSWDSLAVLFDKYRLAIYGKDAIDEGVKLVIVYQAVGKYQTLLA